MRLAINNDANLPSRRHRTVSGILYEATLVTMIGIPVAVMAGVGLSIALSYWMVTTLCTGE